MSINKNICYFFNKNQRLTQTLTTFESSIDLSDVYDFAIKSKFEPMNYGINDNGIERNLDKNIRDSEISLSLFDLGKIKINVIDDKYNVIIERMFEFLKYNPGGHFQEHTDRQRYSTHTHTVCVYPPQIIIGGELIINKNIVIPMSKKSWTIVIFPIDTIHTCEKVIKGTKYLFKSTASITNLQIKQIDKINKKILPPTPKPKD